MTGSNDEQWWTSKTCSWVVFYDEHYSLAISICALAFINTSIKHSSCHEKIANPMSCSRFEQTSTRATISRRSTRRQSWKFVAGVRSSRLFFCRRSPSGSRKSSNREGPFHVPFVHRAEEIRCRARRNSPIVGSGRARGRSFTRWVPLEWIQTVGQLLASTYQSHWSIVRFPQRQHRTRSGRQDGWQCQELLLPTHSCVHVLPERSKSWWAILSWFHHIFYSIELRDHIEGLTQRWFAWMVIIRVNAHNSLTFVLFQLCINHSDATQNGSPGLSQVRSNILFYAGHTSSARFSL